MTKLLVILFSILFSTASSVGYAQTKLGRKIDLVVDASRKPLFNLVYSSPSNELIYISAVMYGDQLVGKEAAIIFPVHWTLVDKESMLQLVGWQLADFPSKLVSPDSAQATNIVISDPTDVASVTKSLGKLALVISLNSLKPTASVYIDLAELCVSHPELFTNMHTSVSGCN